MESLHGHLVRLRCLSLGSPVNLEVSLSLHGASVGLGKDGFSLDVKEKTSKPSRLNPKREPEVGQDGLRQQALLRSGKPSAPRKLIFRAPAGQTSDPKPQNLNPQTLNP